MKQFVYFLTVAAALFLYSCGTLHHNNFNKRKYTNLKSKEALVDVPEVEEQTPEREVLTYPEESTNESVTDENVEVEESDTESVDDKIEPEPVEKKYREKNDSPLRGIIPITSLKDKFSIHPKVQPNQSDKYPVRESELPQFIGWIIYAFLAIAAVVLYLAFLLFNEVVLLLALGILLLLILAIGIAFFISLMRLPEEANTRFMKFMKIATLVEFILAGAILIFAFVVALILVILLAFAW